MQLSNKSIILQQYTNKMIKTGDKIQLMLTSDSRRGKKRNICDFCSLVPEASSKFTQKKTHIQ